MVYLLDLRLLSKRRKQIGQAGSLKDLQAWKVLKVPHLTEQRRGEQGKLEIQVSFCREGSERGHALHMSVVFRKLNGFSKSVLGLVCEFHVIHPFFYVGLYKDHLSGSDFMNTEGSGG